MQTFSINDHFIEELIQTARSKTRMELGTIDDNHDSAYYDGLHDGEIESVRHFLDLLGVEYN